MESSNRERASTVSTNTMSFSGVGASKASSNTCINAMTKTNISLFEHEVLD
jgi:hypothetical protein